MSSSSLFESSLACGCNQQPTYVPLRTDLSGLIQPNVVGRTVGANPSPLLEVNKYSLALDIIGGPGEIRTRGSSKEARSLRRQEVEL
jgi:hypothetical protein